MPAAGEHIGQTPAEIDAQGIADFKNRACRHAGPRCRRTGRNCRHAEHQAAKQDRSERRAGPTSAGPPRGPW